MTILFNIYILKIQKLIKLIKKMFDFVSISIYNKNITNEILILINCKINILIKTEEEYDEREQK